MPGKMTISKSGSGMPPTKRSKAAGYSPPNGNWYLEGHVILHDGTDQIERVERNNARGRSVMDKWGFKRLQHSAVMEIHVTPVVEPTKDREAGYLTKSERPIEIIGLPGVSEP